MNELQKPIKPKKPTKKDPAPQFYIDKGYTICKDSDGKYFLDKNFYSGKNSEVKEEELYYFKLHELFLFLRQDFKINASHNTDGYFEFYYITIKEHNINYKKELDEYENRFIKYKSDLEKYNEDLKIYKFKLAEYKLRKYQKLCKKL